MLKMEANDFVMKLKADGSTNDICDVVAISKQYKEILTKIPLKDRPRFALNVLCTFCRNLEKVPSWRSKAEPRGLLSLSVDVAREARPLVAERAQLLACLCHLHKYGVRLTIPVPPEFILKISYMAFECADNSMKEYCKTFWNIIIDRLVFIEKLKSSNISITKLLPKLTEDILKVIQIYDSILFCKTALQFLVKKLHFLYNNVSATDLNNTFEQIIETLLKKTDLKSAKTLPAKELMSLYVIVNDCLYVIVENSTKLQFKHTPVNSAVRFCLSILGHSPDLFHCIQTFYLNSLCCIFNELSDSSLVENIFNNLPISCETTEKLGYRSVMDMTYPFICQLLRLYIDYYIANSDRLTWKEHFNEQKQEAFLNILLYLMDKLKDLNIASTHLKCEKCTVKSCSHDALRISFCIKSFISISAEQKLSISTLLEKYLSVIVKQYELLNHLRRLGCPNYEKFYRKLQSDVHNSAILLNKSSQYEFSGKLFTKYIQSEVLYFKTEAELKNISRALYNKAICELEAKLYENSLRNAYLSLVFAQPDLTSDKYMSLVMDVKAKMIKSKADDEDDAHSNIDQHQLITVLDICDQAAKESEYGNLKPFFNGLPFCALLKHEFSLYAKLWPSLVPVAGVWRALRKLILAPRFGGVAQENPLATLYEVILVTPNVVRTIHCDYYKQIVKEMLGEFDLNPPTTAEQKVFHVTLMLLSAEYGLHDASAKYGWKITEPNLDPDLPAVTRTIEREHVATKNARKAVQIWTDILQETNEVSPQILNNALKITEVFVPMFLHMDCLIYGLQLAHICCILAQNLNDREIYIRNAGVILKYTNKHTKEITTMLFTAFQWCGDLWKDENTLDNALTFICNAAMFYTNVSQLGMAARLVRIAHQHLIDAMEKYPKINLQQSTGALLSTCLVLSPARPGLLAAATARQRHYLTAHLTESKWTTRRLYALTLKCHLQNSALFCAQVCVQIQCGRRAMAAGALGLPAASAGGAAKLAGALVGVCEGDEALTKIENRMKYILGLQPSMESPIYHQNTKKKTALFTPKPELETMLESATFKRQQISPSVPCLTVPAFKTPEFLTHDISCQCQCQNMSFLTLICQTCGLEAGVYARAEEFDIAGNYFDGALKCYELAESKIRIVAKSYSDFEQFIVDSVQSIHLKELRRNLIEVLLEACFYKMACNESTDELLVRIQELSDNLGTNDEYLKNNIFNATLASAWSKKRFQIPKVESLEVELANLKLSPEKVVPLQKTPEAKPRVPPSQTKIVVKQDEIPKNKRKVIKLNLEDTEETQRPIRKQKDKFKIPIPITNKPAIESTPGVKPSIRITKAEESIFDFVTPKPKEEFHTPIATPADQFFTPMTSVKTYTKKTLKQSLIKNLEAEFSTPKAETVIDKENKPQTSEASKSKVKVESGLKSLKRATSPGKLRPTGIPTRATRLRQPKMGDKK